MTRLGESALRVRMTSLMDIDREVGLDGRDGWLVAGRRGQSFEFDGAGSVAAAAAAESPPFFASPTPSSGNCQGSSSTDLFSADKCFNIFVNHVRFELRPWSLDGFGCFWRVLLIRQTINTTTVAINGPNIARMIMAGLDIPVLDVDGEVGDTVGLVIVGDGVRVTLIVTTSVAVEGSVALQAVESVH